MPTPRSTSPRVWFITGAGRGLGRAFAEAALAAGDCVVGTVRRPGALDDLIDRHPETLVARPLDVRDRAAVADTVDRAVELAVEHANGRVQFGKPIATFQAVQFQLADAAVAVAGLRQLAAFTLWRLDHAPDDATPHVLALRQHARDVARSGLRTSHQLHGAAGVCDEYDISVLTRLVQPALRLPWSAERTVTELSGAIDRDGFLGLFPHGRKQ